ncbi:MAG: hypothetical protein ACJAVH_001833 [Bacteroidia bacterium]|jgi:hypothetical protein
MAKINGIEGLNLSDINEEVQRGGKFVSYTYCISIILMTFKRPTDIYFIKADQNATVKGLPYTFISLILGWWGIPWGPIYTIGALFSNLGGGKDLTAEVLQHFMSSVQEEVAIDLDGDGENE